MAGGNETPKEEKQEPSVRRGSKSIWPWKKETDGSASFLRAARAGNLEKVLEFLKTNTDINTCNANGLNALHLASKEGHTNVVSALLERSANVDSATKKGNTALHIASLAGQDEIVKVLVENGATVNIQSQNGFTPLYMAAQENHDSVVRFLLSHGANQSLATEDGFTPLAVALQQGHDRVVSVLLENDTRGKVRLPALHIAAKKDDAKAAALLLHTDHNPDITSKSGFTPLHIASHYGNDNIAGLLIQRGADVNYVAKHQITPLHVASKWGKGNMVSLLLDKGANIEAKTRDGLTPLHCAARSGHETVVDMLLEKGAPITAKTKNGLAPLHMASQGDHVDAARILLYHKAPVDDVTVDFLTALHVAAHCGHVRVAKLLLDRKADPNSRALNGFTPLHIACKKNRIKVVELLLKHGASIEATTESGLTPLHVASFMGCMNIVIYLIQHGASADVPTVRGESPLHLAARANQTDIIRILLRNGAEVDAKAREQQTALHIASRLGNTDIVGLLLQQGASVDAPTKDLYTPLHIAAKEGQEEVAGVLLDHGASLNTATKKGFTPLHLAAKYGHLKVARLLLQRDAPVDPKGKNGVTPLHVAAHYDNQNVAMLLLDKGAQPHATAKNGYTPLHIAARKNQMDIAGTLLEYGANANAESKAGFTPLHLSAQEGHTDMATLLLEHGAQPGGAAKNGLTPLHLCAQEDRVPVGAILVKHGAAVDAQTKAGYTPLHVAAHFGQMNMVRFLLQHGTKVDAPTQLGYTPLHQAAQQGHTQIVNLLLENKAQPNMETNDGKTALSIAQRLGYISVVETLKIVTETRVVTNTTTTTEEKYKVVVPETMHETFMSESEDEGADDTMLGDQSYRYLTVDEMKSLGDDSLPIDVTRDEKMDVSFTCNLVGSAPGDHISPLHKKEMYGQNYPTDNIDVGKAPILAGPESLNTTMNTSFNLPEDDARIVNDESRAEVPDQGTTQSQSHLPATVTSKATHNEEINNIWDQFLVSFMVDARGGAMRGCRHSGVRVIIPPRKAAMPMRITCRYLKKDKLVHAPPLMEGEALASRILEMGPSGAKFLGPVIIEVPHFASLRGKEREIVILRSDNGETWREHTLEATEEAVQEVLNESFDGEELKQLEDLNTNRITRILTTDFPQYFAIVTRIRQEVHAIGPEGGMVSSTVVPQVQAVFPQGALTKKIKVGLQAQPISTDLVAKLLGNRVAVSPIVTVEPRRRKFHKPITLTIPVPQAASKGMINQYSGEAPTLRLLCSITGGTTRAQWEDVTGSTPLTFVNDCVSFTTTVSARFWLMDCTNIPEATKMATELYREAIHVPFMAKFVVFSKRHQLEEARVRVFCMTDDKEDKTLESQEHFIEVAKSRDVEVLEGKSQYLEFAGNLIPVTKSGDQLAFNFYAFRENRLPFTVRVKDQNAESVGRVAFMRQPKVGRGDAPQSPICNLNLSLPDNIQPEPAPSEPDLLALEKKYAFLSISKAETIHKADLRLSDISNMLTGDWVALAKELEIRDSDINIIKSQYPDNAPQQAVVMLRLWMQTAGNKATGNTLEKALRSIHRDDIVDECICNLEVVTDVSEKATAEQALIKEASQGKSIEEALPIKRTPSPETYEEKDLMKDAESADEDEVSHKIIAESQREKDLSPTYETEERKYAAEEKIVKEIENIIQKETFPPKEEKKLSKDEKVPPQKEEKISPKDEKKLPKEDKKSPKDGKKFPKDEKKGPKDDKKYVREEIFSKKEKIVSETKTEETIKTKGNEIDFEKKEESMKETKEEKKEEKRETTQEKKTVEKKEEEKEILEEKKLEERKHFSKIPKPTAGKPPRAATSEEVSEHITSEKRTSGATQVPKPRKEEFLQKLGEELGKLDQKLEEKFKEKNKKFSVPNGEEEEVSEMPIVPQPRSSSTIQPTTQVVVESVEEIRKEVVEPVLVENISESHLVEETPSYESPAEEDRYAQISEQQATDSRESSDEEGEKLITDPTLEAFSHSERLDIEMDDSLIQSDYQIRSEEDKPQELIADLSYEVAGEEQMSDIIEKDTSDIEGSDDDFKRTSKIHSQEEHLTYESPESLINVEENLSLEVHTDIDPQTIHEVHSESQIERDVSVKDEELHPEEIQEMHEDVLHSEYVAPKMESHFENAPENIHESKEDACYDKDVIESNLVSDIQSEKYSQDLFVREDVEEHSQELIEKEDADKIKEEEFEIIHEDDIKAELDYEMESYPETEIVPETAETELLIEPDVNVQKDYEVTFPDDDVNIPKDYEDSHPEDEYIHEEVTFDQHAHDQLLEEESRLVEKASVPVVENDGNEEHQIQSSQPYHEIIEETQEQPIDYEYDQYAHDQLLEEESRLVEKASIPVVESDGNEEHQIQSSQPYHEIIEEPQEQPIDYEYDQYAHDQLLEEESRLVEKASIPVVKSDVNEEHQIQSSQPYHEIIEETQEQPRDYEYEPKEIVEPEIYKTEREIPEHEVGILQEERFDELRHQDPQEVQTFETTDETETRIEPEYQPYQEGSVELTTNYPLEQQDVIPSTEQFVEDEFSFGNKYFKEYEPETTESQTLLESELLLESEALSEHNQAVHPDPERESLELVGGIDDDSKHISELPEESEEAVTQDGLTQPSAESSQMGPGDQAPSDVKPPVTATAGEPTSELQQTKKETSAHRTKSEDSSKGEDVGVVFTEPKESGGGEKLPSEKKGEQIFPQSVPISHTSFPPTLQSHDDSRPQRRHERTYSQASNVISSTIHSDNAMGQVVEMEHSVEDSIKPYSERKQFWETVTSQSSFETKSPVTKSETESDTDTGTDGTVIEQSMEKSFVEPSDSEQDSVSQKREDSVCENVVTFREKRITKEAPVSQDLPSPDDISLKDVKTKKEMFEKEIKRQSSELEESLGWKRSSKDEDDSSTGSPQSGVFITEKITISSDMSSVSEKQSEKKISEQKIDTDILHSIEKTQKEKTLISEISKEEKEKHEKTIDKGEKIIHEKEVVAKEDIDKKVTDDLEKTRFKSLEEKEDGSVVKTKFKETSTAHTSHEQLEGKSETVVVDYDKENGQTSRQTLSSTSTVDFKETTSSNLITSETKYGVKSALGVAPQLSSSDSTNGSFERSDSTKESFDKSPSISGTPSSLSKKQSTLTSSADEHDLSEFPEDSSRTDHTSEDEGNKIVEKKVEEERRTFGDTEELLVREITTTREGDQEQRVIKETKTQETVMPDGSTVKTTSVTTFTTQLDRNDSEDTVDQSEESASSTTEKEKSEVLLKQIKADMMAEAIQNLPSDEVSPEHKLLSPDDPKAFKSTTEPAKPLASPIHVPEESVQDIVWEVSQEQSDVAVSETVQYIPDEGLEPSGESKVKFVDEEPPKNIVLSEEEARSIAREIVEEVKTEALKRSPVSDKEIIINRVQIEERVFLPKPTTASAFTSETSSKLEKYIQEQLGDESLDEKHLSLLESVAARKTELLRKRLGTDEVQLSLEITDEDLKSSGAELSPIETHMERLRQMTEDEELTKSGREPSEADESESSMIIHETFEESFTSGYDQANQMFNKTLDNVKAVSLKGERAIDTICEEMEEVERSDTGQVEKDKYSYDRKKSREELTEAAIEIVKEITVKARESELLKQLSSDQSKDDSDTSVKEGRKSLREDLLKHDKSLEVQMESSMTESVEECSAAESTRAYDSKFVTEMSKSSIQEVTDNGCDKKSPDKLSSPPEEIRLRKKKSHIDEFNRRSGTDFDAYSSSGESHYFTAAEGTDSRSVSRPCSSDIDALLSGTPGTSEYDTAPTSQDGSQYSRGSSSSREFSTAPSDISSRDSMKSIDSESSGNLGSIELSSEASETLVPSALDLEKDMEILDRDILDEELLRTEGIIHSDIPQLTIQSETPRDEDAPSPFDTETDDTEYDTKEDQEDIPHVSSKMKRSMEMTFHPEPKILKEDQDDYIQGGLEESTISDLSVTTVVERDRNILESSTSATNMTSSNISDENVTVETRDASTEHFPSNEEEIRPVSAGETRAVTSTSSSVPPTYPDQHTASICTQVTSDIRSDNKDDSFFRTNGPTEIEYVSQDDDAVDTERPADVPMNSSEREYIGAIGGHSVGPDSSYIESYETEADQEYGQMIREGEDADLLEAEIQRAIDSQPEDEIDTDYLKQSDPVERPKTPEPGSISKLRITTSQDSEELTEVDKRFSAIFSVTYEEPASPATLIVKESNGNVPDITVTEHMAPIDVQYRYPDLECDDEFPECRANGTETTSHSSSVTSPKSSTTDSEHGREYCLDSQTEGPVQYSDYGSFEVLEAGDIADLNEFENTILYHEKRLRDLTIKEEEEVSSQDSKVEDSPILPPAVIKAIKLDTESPSSSGDGDLSRDLEDPSYNSSIEEQRRWLEMQFEENSRKTIDFEYPQQSFVEHIYSGPLEDIEEEDREDCERRDLSHLTKTPSLSSTPEYDVLAGRKFFTRSGEQDDVSMSSLQEFENFEREVAIEQATRRSSSGSQESLNGKRPGSGGKSVPGDDISVSSFSSLNEFERLEKEFMIVEQIETKVKTEEKILSEIEEGHESQVSESESCETISDPGRESPDSYDQKIFEIDEIIRQAQTNVENFEKEGVLLKDIVGLSCSTDDRTPSVEPQDSLEETLPTSKKEQDTTSQKRSDTMVTSSDSLDSKHAKDILVSSVDSLEDKRKCEAMTASADSIETDRRDLMATSADSLGRDDSSGREGDISSESERVSHPHGGVMDWSTDSLEPTSSQATHATYQYETDSIMSGSFTSGCSTTLMPSIDDIGDLMSTSMYLPEGELPDDSVFGASSGSGRYEWTKVKPEGIITEVIEESSEPEYSQTVTRTVALPPDVKQVTFTGPDAKQKLEQYVEQFNTGEHTTETETVDLAGNVHVQKVVQKRIVIDPEYAEQEGIVLSEPKVEESFVKDEHGNVTRVVRRTVISTHTVEIDLDTGEPIIRRESSLPESTQIHSSLTTHSVPPPSPSEYSHPSGSPSGSHSPREPLPTSLEPNTASGFDVEHSTTFESYGEPSENDGDDDEVDPSLTTITDTAPSFSVNTTTTTTTSVESSGGVKTTLVTTRFTEEWGQEEEEDSEMNEDTGDETLRKIDTEKNENN